ncbi:AAA family ATPase, partial [Klebsiella pneumoniae]|uniref:AAA family ATPase n=1 Tax=Klebsiella pneumoniae TaxID=573 RepID=UPI0025A198F4
MYSENERIIITGGPGSGKSTLLNSLRAKGYPTAAEAGRAIIRNQVAIGGNALPWMDREAFAG